MFVGRKKYLEFLKKWNNSHFIKVLVGIRRCGKSTLLDEFRKTLKNNNVIYYDFNDLKYVNMKYRDLHREILKKANSGKINYVFLDEIQEVNFFDKAIISLFENKEIKFDIYLTGSNSHMFSEELATLFTGRKIEVKINPLSFNEIYLYISENENKERVLEEYLQKGGLGIIINEYNNNEKVFEILNNVLNDVINKDILKRHKSTSNEYITKILKYMALNFGRSFNSQNILNYLKTNNKNAISANTLNRYINWICESLILNKVYYFDKKTKSILKNKCKYFAGDLGLINPIIGFDISLQKGYRLENLIYLELINKEYKVYTYADRYGSEVDFVAIKNNEIKYIQVCDELNNDNYARESKGLLSIIDANKKIILYKTHNVSIENNDGIAKIYLFDWLMNKVNI